MQLTRFPRFRLGHFPTPLEFLPNLTRHLAGPDIYIKRDDCTGLATGGNKTRKLEFLVAHAQEQGADVLITQGAVQSNHVRQTAAAAVIAGMKCKILLEERVRDAPEEYAESGNVMLDHLLGANIAARLPAGSDMARAMEDLAADLRRQGHKPYIRSDVVANTDYVGDGYGLATPAMIDAIQLAARTDAILLDPVYSGKGIAGMIDLIRKGHFKKGENVVFIHTGGTVGLYAYGHIFGS